MICMSTFVVALFPTEAKAYDGTRAMKDLQAEGSFMLYGMAVVTKAADGKLAVKETVEKGPLGTAVGLLTGGVGRIARRSVGGRDRRCRRGINRQLE